MDALRIKLAIETRIIPFAQHIKVSPNAITLAALLITLTASGFVLAESPLIAGFLIAIAGVMDILDGAVAKAHNKATPFGALLDRVSDRVSDFAMLSAFIAAGYVHVVLGLYVLLTVMLASYISACIEAATKSHVGEKLSLRAVRIVLIVLGSITMRIDETMFALAIVGTYASLARMLQAYRLLNTGVQA
jgi:archaetidylinositol phosphate synthase